MLQNILVTALTTLKDDNKIAHWENKPFCGVWPDTKNKKTGISKTIKKKPKRIRTAYTTEQIKILERKYLENKYIDTDSRRELAKQLNIEEKCIKIWYQNRRMKEKRESSDSDSSSDNMECIVQENVPNEQPTQSQNNAYNFNNNFDVNSVQIPNNFNGYQMPQYNEMQCFNGYPTEYYPSDCTNYYNDNQNQYGYYGNWQSNEYPCYYYNFN